MTDTVRVEPGRGLQRGIAVQKSQLTNNAHFPYVVFLTISAYAQEAHRVISSQQNHQNQASVSVASSLRPPPGGK